MAIWLSREKMKEHRYWGLIWLKICCMEILVSSIAFGFSFKFEGIIIVQAFVRMYMSELITYQPRRTIADAIEAPSQLVLSQDSIIDFNPVIHEHTLH